MGRKSIAEERKEEILQHYYEVVMKDGFENASIAKIAAHMNIQPSLIIHYFKNKDNLIFELLKKYMQEHVQEKIEQFYLEDDLYERLEMLLDFTTTKGKFPEGLQKIQHIVRYLAVHNENIRKELIDRMEHYKELLRKILDEFYQSGIIANFDTETLSTFFMILVGGMEDIHPVLIKEEEDYYSDYLREIFKEKLQIIYE